MVAALALITCAAGLFALAPSRADDGPAVVAAGGPSAESYRWMGGVTAGLPGWLFGGLDLAASAGILALLVLAVMAARRRWRTRPPESVWVPAVACGVVVAYLLSDLVKAYVAQDRPCRLLAGAFPHSSCPPPGRWSFPSNHATVAAALATAALLLSVRLAVVASALALVVVVARVFAGDHYPHDVAGGLLLGTTVTRRCSPCRSLSQ